MNEKLRKAKQDLKRIDSFCHSRPIPKESDVKEYLTTENLTEYSMYAMKVTEAVWESEFILHTLKKSDR